VSSVVCVNQREQIASFDQKQKEMDDRLAQQKIVAAKYTSM
jgi:hypothetical protein